MEQHSQTLIQKKWDQNQKRPKTQRKNKLFNTDFSNPPKKSNKDKQQFTIFW